MLLIYKKKKKFYRAFMVYMNQTFVIVFYKILNAEFQMQV